MWQRSDGAILWLRSKIIVRLELPAAHEYKKRNSNRKRNRKPANQFRNSDVKYWELIIENLPQRWMELRLYLKYRIAKAD